MMPMQTNGAKANISWQIVPAMTLCLACGQEVLREERVTVQRPNGHPAFDGCFNCLECLYRGAMETRSLLFEATRLLRVPASECEIDWVCNASDALLSKPVGRG